MKFGMSFLNFIIIMNEHILWKFYISFDRFISKSSSQLKNSATTLTIWPGTIVHFNRLTTKTVTLMVNQRGDFEIGIKFFVRMVKKLVMGGSSFKQDPFRNFFDFLINNNRQLQDVTMTTLVWWDHFGG